MNGKIFTDTNQTARASEQANAKQGSLIADRISTKEIAKGKALPNGNMATAHAEISAIRETYPVSQKVHIILDGAGYHRGELMKEWVYVMNIDLHDSPPNRV